MSPEMVREMMLRLKAEILAYGGVPPSNYCLERMVREIGERAVEELAAAVLA